MKCSKLALLSGCALLALPAERAMAAEPSGQADTAVQELVVTARRREERLLDVPVAATALSTQAMERYQSSDLTFLATQVPQLQIDQGASGNLGTITLRGLGSTSVDAGIEQVVSINIDGVPISRGSAIAESSFDQASLQVLKGPQALYFGKNSPAGVVVLTSRDPADHFEGFARGGYEFETREAYAEGGVSIPLTEALRKAKPGDTLQVTGTCHERVTITTDQLTLDGGAGAVL